MTIAHHRFPRQMRALLTAVITIALAACTPENNKEPEPTVNTNQAAQRIETHIEETLAELPDTAQLTDPYKEHALPCDAPDDGGSEDRVIVEHDYVISGLSRENFRTYFETIQRHWEKRGYRQLRLERNGPYVNMVYTDADGFRLNLVTSADGTQISINSQSPCIWPNGTPPEGN